MNDIIPMPSARMGNGRYEVIGTSHGVECFRQGRYWYLAVDDARADDGPYIGPFRTKRQALQFVQESPEL